MSFQIDEATGKKLGGVLNNWYQKKITYVSGRAGFSIVFGNLDNDNRWRDGTKIRTSPVVNLDEENNRLETNNTVYELGSPLNVDEFVPTGLVYGIDEFPGDVEIDDTDNSDQ